MIVPHFLLKAQVGRSDFRNLAEEKVSEFLQAEVKIDDIQVGFLNKLAFTGIHIQETGDEPGNVLQVRQIIFRYDPFRLITQNFKTPNSVILESPKISLREGSFPYDFFQKLDFGEGATRITRLEMIGGQVQYPITGWDSKLEIRDIHGSFRPLGAGKLGADFQATLAGFLRGNIRAQGEINLLKRTHQLRLVLDSVNFAKEVFLPLEDLMGKMRWENNDLYFDELKVLVHGWKIRVGGKLERLMSRPLLELRGSFGKRDPFSRWSFKADLESGELKAEAQPGLKGNIPLEGRIRQDEEKFYFDDLRINGRYDGHGWLNHRNGDYEMNFEKDVQRISVSSNLRQRQWKVKLNFDHIRFYGWDIVTSAQVDFKPLASASAKKQGKFLAEFKTDYFILQQAPFADFKGRFEASLAGIKRLQGTWGESFRLEGDVRFPGGKPYADLTLKVEDFDLGTVKEFANKPLPKELGGLLEGKLKIEGPLEKSDVIGHFTVKDGKLGRLDYDRGIIQFRGIPPYLKIYDSRILKGRSTLSIEGVLDLSLGNIFHGVHVRTADKFIIWKGWEMVASPDGGGLEIQRISSALPTFAILGGTESGSESQDGGIYKEEESYVGMGPKIEF